MGVDWCRSRTIGTVLWKSHRTRARVRLNYCPNRAGSDRDTSQKRDINRRLLSSGAGKRETRGGRVSRGLLDALLRLRRPRARARPDRGSGARGESNQPQGRSVSRLGFSPSITRDGVEHLYATFCLFLYSETPPAKENIISPSSLILWVTRGFVAHTHDYSERVGEEAPSQARVSFFGSFLGVSRE